MKLVIAGGSGTLGRRIGSYLSSPENEIVVLTRSPRADFPFRQVVWDGRTVGGWASELDRAVLINLAGELVDRRPTRANIELLRTSRVEPTCALVEASQTFRPAVWVQASSTAIYGDAGATIITEESEIPSGPPQMPGVAVPWEQAANGANADRQVIFRMSLVLHRDTPVLDRLSLLVKLGLGGRISSGRQWVSWIHVGDMLRALRFVIDGEVEGVVNVTSPKPVRNETLMKQLRQHLNRPWSPPMPAPLVKLGAWLMGSDPAIALTGRRCVPARLLKEGFDFELPDLPFALDNLFGSGDRKGARVETMCGKRCQCRETENKATELAERESAPGSAFLAVLAYNAGTAVRTVTAHSGGNKSVAGRPKFIHYTLIFRLDAGKELRPSIEDALFC
jgi:uncharacterized protein (TIGR01777 family)